MNRNLIIGSVLSAVFLLLAAVSFVWTPFDIQTLDIPNKLKSPSGANLLGTDHFGRDILSMIMMGARTSIAVALVAVLAFEPWRGVRHGYRSGWWPVFGLLAVLVSTAALYVLGRGLLPV